jgi:PPK2 family polyphosphate:nucleotide phosphotransferase
MSLSIKVNPGEQVRLSGIGTEGDSGLSKEEADERLEGLSKQLGKLQELLYAARRHSLLVILQGMDTSGKDGTIRQVMSEVNPQGCRVESFKVPTEQELAHDFLWRAHNVTPPRGMMTIFNRSHYEDVLVVRVHGLVPESAWGLRYGHINDFERMLTDNGTIILKFYLHLSREEQRRRLEAREQDAGKAWKLSAGDWREREFWGDYMRAYDDAITRSATGHAPWHIVPADKKPFRNLAVAEALVDALSPYRGEWEACLSRLAESRLAELRAVRAADGEAAPGG